MTFDFSVRDDVVALRNLIPRSFATTPTRLSASDYARANQLFDSGDRTGMYLFLAEKTGNPAYINTAQISSGSGCTIGGPAIAVNAALQAKYPDLYPSISIGEFSQFVARVELQAFKINTDSVTGQVYYTGPSELDSYKVGRDAWATVVPGRPQVVDLFPGNFLLAAHYYSLGQIETGDRYVSQQSALVGSELYKSLANEILNIGTQYGKTITQSWAVERAGGSVSSEIAPGSNTPLLVFRDSTGKVYSVFTRADVQLCGRESNSPGLGVPNSIVRKVVFTPDEFQNLDVDSLVQKVSFVGGDTGNFAQGAVDTIKSAFALYSGQVDAYLNENNQLVLMAGYRQTVVDFSTEKWASTFVQADGNYLLQNSDGANFRYTVNLTAPEGIDVSATLDTPIGPLKSNLDSGLDQVSGQQVTTVLNDIASVIGAIQGGKPLPILNSGLRLVNNIANPAGTAVQYPGLNIGTGIVSGLASLYNLAKDGLQNPANRRALRSVISR